MRDGTGKKDSSRKSDDLRKTDGSRGKRAGNGQSKNQSRFIRFLTSPVTTIAAFVVAIALLLGSSIGGARAALTYFSETYASQVQMSDIGVTLVENGKDVAWRNYNSSADGSWDEATGEMFADLSDGTVQPGRSYPEEIRVRNSGNINQYVRVIIRKYWLDAEGNQVDPRKMTELTPDLIRLNLLTDDGWVVDDAASTTERTVLYYTRLLYADGSSEGQSVSSPLSDTLTIDSSVADKVSQTIEKDGNYTIITTTYDYDGVRFCIEAEVDAVQEHNAADAILSAWGRRVSVSDGILSLE